MTRLKAYVERVKDEVAPQARESDLAEATGCPGVGRTWAAGLAVGAEHSDPHFIPIKNWLTSNGFSVTERTADDVRTVTGRSMDGFTVELNLRFIDQVDLTFTSPCSLPTGVPGGPTTPLAAPKSGLEAPSLRLACEKPQRYVLSPSAAQFSGPGLHPIALNRSLPPDAEATDVALPEKWDAASSYNGELDKTRIQLIICITATPGASAGRVACDYNPRPLTLPIREATYQAVVRTARTGQKVAAFVLPGTSSGQDSCPRFINYDEQTVLLRVFTSDALQTKLRPLVTGRR